MGMQKHYLDQEESKRDLAEMIALKAKAIKTCRAHEEVILSTNDSNATKQAYQIAAKEIKSRKYESFGFESQKELTDLIKEIIDSSLGSCQRCAKF